MVKCKFCSNIFNVQMSRDIGFLGENQKCIGRLVILSKLKLIYIVCFLFHCNFKSKNILPMEFKCACCIFQSLSLFCSYSQFRSQISNGLGLDPGPGLGPKLVPVLGPSPGPVIFLVVASVSVKMSGQVPKCLILWSSLKQCVQCDDLISSYQLPLRLDPGYGVSHSHFNWDRMVVS